VPGLRRLLRSHRRGACVHVCPLYHMYNSIVYYINNTHPQPLDRIQSNLHTLDNLHIHPPTDPQRARTTQNPTTTTIESKHKQHNTHTQTKTKKQKNEQQALRWWVGGLGFFFGLLGLVSLTSPGDHNPVVSIYIDKRGREGE
jgi:L-lactate utilization protein LutB